MKKGKLLSLLGVVLVLTGCSCSKMDGSIYEKAYNNYLETDAFAYSRTETIQVSGEDKATKIVTEAKYELNEDKSVKKMELVRKTSKVLSNGSLDLYNTEKYHYDGTTQTLYVYTKQAQSAENTYKKTGKAYEDFFSVNSCKEDACYPLIFDRLFKIFSIDEMSTFEFSKDGDLGVVKFAAVCPTFEDCKTSQDDTEFEVRITKDAEFKSMQYTVVNGTTTHTIQYSFKGFGSLNVEVNLPAELNGYPLIG